MKPLPERGVWPVPPSMPEVRGLFTGGCVSRGVGSSFRATAHAHVSGEWMGWICVRGREEVYRYDGETPSRTLMHEYAHIVSGTGHDAHWRGEMARLCQPIEAKYVRRSGKGRTE